MSRFQQSIVDSVQQALVVQDEQAEALRVRQMQVVLTKTATGSGDMDALFSLERRFRLVFIRCHFVGGTGLAPLTLALDSNAGAAYDAVLFTLVRAGTNRDVNFRISVEENADPSPWTFQPGSQLRLRWTNPDSGNMTWGLSVGLANAS